MPATQTTKDFTDEIARRQEVGDPAIDRYEAIVAIRTALKRRTGRTWSVTGGRGTAWGWITVTAPPKRRVDGYYLSEDDAAVLGEAMGMEGAAHMQGVSIAADTSYRIEYVARAEGRRSSVVGRQYWD